MNPKDVKKPEWLNTADAVAMGVLASTILVLWIVFLLKLGFAFWRYLGQWL